MSRYQSIEPPFLFPAGDYIIGDPCYTVPDEHWEPLLSSCDFFQNNPIGVTPDGVFVLSFGTAWGDGVYQDQQGRNYPVDAGMIGLISVEAAKVAGWTEFRPDITNIINFPAPFTCYSLNGLLNFGHIDIDTDPDYDDEEGDE